MKYECNSCGHIGKAKNERSKKVQVLLLILGFLTFGVGWAALIIYRVVKKPYACGNCGKCVKKN